MANYVPLINEYHLAIDQQPILDRWLMAQNGHLTNDFQLLNIGIVTID